MERADARDLQQSIVAMSERDTGGRTMRPPIQIEVFTDVAPCVR